MAAPDWRKAEDYAWLEELDLSGLAWEFLRRNPDYRADGPPPPAAGPDWGLVARVDPELDARQAPVFWRPDVAPAHVLRLAASPQAGAGGPDLARLARASLITGGETHLRLAGGVQLVAPLGGGASLALLTPLDGMLGVRLATARALERLLAGRRAARDALSALSRRRLLQMLRALDAFAAAASHRQVAETVLGRRVESRADWRTGTARDVAVRLSRSAWRMARGGYLGLLRRGRPP